MRLAYGFGNRLDSFRKAMEAMHAQLVKAGDAAYQVEVFPGYYVQFLLWEGDEEFAPSSRRFCSVTIFRQDFMRRIW